MALGYQQALAHLYHGIDSAVGFVLLTGELAPEKQQSVACNRALLGAYSQHRSKFTLYYQQEQPHVRRIY